MAAILGGSKFFGNFDVHCAQISCGSKILSKSLYLAQFSRYKHFCKKFENLKWKPFWARQNFFENCDGHSAEIPCGSKISSKSLYLAWFPRYKHFFVLQFLRKIRKFKMTAILGKINFFFLKIGIATLQRYPGGPKISSKLLYLARFSRYKHFCAFLTWKTRPFLNQSMPNSNDFQMLIE